jgi:hypothetical protein
MSVAIAANFLVLSAIVVSLMAPTGIAFWLDGSSAIREINSTSVLALRLISIPFGISESAELLEGGQVVRVTGHGECPEGSETFRLRVQIGQQDIPAPGTGFIEGTCPSGELITWVADVTAPEAFTFEPGPAEVCGKAVIHRSREGAFTFDWCKEVILH